jgi:hypothetical protein
MALLRVDLRLVLKKVRFGNHVVSRRTFDLSMQMRKVYPELVNTLFSLTYTTYIPPAVWAIAGNEHRLFQACHLSFFCYKVVQEF